MTYSAPLMALARSDTKLVLPLRVGQCGEATGAPVRAADGVDQDVQDAEALADPVDDVLRRRAC
jgi:hypothetical protein